jgi:hypothetical protein
VFRQFPLAPIGNLAEQWKKLARSVEGRRVVWNGELRNRRLHQYKLASLTLERFLKVLRICDVDIHWALRGVLGSA